MKKLLKIDGKRLMDIMDDIEDVEAF